MSGMVETIKKVAAFADLKEDKAGLSQSWTAIQFRPGECYANNSVSGARAPIELDLECAVPAARLLKALKAVNGEPTFELTKQSLIVRSGKTKATLPTYPTRDAPALRRPEGAQWAHTAALAAASRVLWSVSDDVTRPHLGGLWLGARGMEATNGHSMCRLGGTDFADLLGAPEGVLVPPQALRGLASEVWVAVSERKVHRPTIYIAEDDQGASYRLSALIESTFPPTDQILGGARKQPAATVPRMLLIDCVRRAKLSSSILLIDVTTKALAVNVEGGVSGGQGALFDFMDSVPLEDSKVKPMQIGVDARYFLPLLENTVGENITMRLGTELDPIVVEDGDYVGVVMPYRI